MKTRQFNNDQISFDISRALLDTNLRLRNTFLWVTFCWKHCGGLFSEPFAMAPTTFTFVSLDIKHSVVFTNSRGTKNANLCFLATKVKTGLQKCCLASSYHEYLVNMKFSKCLYIRATVIYVTSDGTRTRLACYSL